MTGSVSADRRLCLTADQARVVEADDPAAAYLFATPGTLLSAEDLERYGLTVEEGVLRLPGPRPVLADKAVAVPQGDKAAAPMKRRRRTPHVGK